MRAWSRQASMPTDMGMSLGVRVHHQRRSRLFGLLRDLTARGVSGSR